MRVQHPFISSAALVAVCLGSVSLVACKDGDADTLATTNATMTATMTATDGDSMPTGDTGDSTPTGDTSDSTPTGDPTGDPTGEPMDGPHALGTILLGESHPTAGGKTTPFVSAFFIPDAEGTGAAACSESVAGCQLALVPDCNDTCDVGEYCGFDAGCKATCQTICDASCAAGEVCYFPAPGTTGCKKIETFDAGALTFINTPIPITLFPPYAFMSDASASPFAPGGSASIQASGASNAGFEKFDKSFTGTDFMQTSPKLDTLGFAEVFGDGPLPVKWNPGTGEVTITATVQSPDFKFGTLTCKADDASGGFDIPREALKAAIDGGDIMSLTVSVQRQRTDWHKDLTTKGELTGVTVQPVGYLQIITSSTETHSFMGCAQGEAVCNNVCVDVQFDNANCGGCGKACGAEDTCEDGTCSGVDACNACETASQTGACKAENDACAADPTCKTFEACFTKCQTQECADTCAMGLTQEDINLYNAQIECLCEEACVGECAPFC